MFFTLINRYYDERYRINFYKSRMPLLIVLFLLFDKYIVSLSYVSITKEGRSLFV